MNATLNKKPVGRPRKFSVQEGLDIAEKLFHQFGYESVSINDLCSHLKVPPTSIYSAFGSKFALYKNTIELNAKEFIESLEMELNSQHSVAEIFRTALEFSAQQFTRDVERPGSYFLDANLETKDQKLHELVSVNTQKLVQSLTNKLKAIRAPNHNELAKALVTLIRSLSSEVRLQKDPDELFITTEIFCSAFE